MAYQVFGNSLTGMWLVKDNNGMAICACESQTWANEICRLLNLSQVDYTPAVGSFRPIVKP